MRIPKIIHQTWKTSDVPQNLAQDFLSWKKHHPTYQFIGWDDASLLAFVESEFPQHLDLFKSYAQQIERVNMARYLILKRIGGIFVDLDLECLKPIEPLLDEWTILVGCEPDSHAEHPAATRYGLSKFVGTAFLASVPEHPFWDHVIAQLPYFRHHHDPLETIGPIFLTNAIHRWDDKSQIALAPAPLLYPFDRAQTWSGATYDIEFWEQNTREAFAVHHWEGTWLVKSGRETTRPAKLKGQLLSQHATVGQPIVAQQGALPGVSCIMLRMTAEPDRDGIFKLAIDSYRRQTYPNRELIIVTDSQQDELTGFVRELGDASIQVHTIPNRQWSRGEVQNFAREKAAGDYVANWSPSAIYDPIRLEYQFLGVRVANAHASVLTRIMHWEPDENRLSLSRITPWEESLFAERTILPEYPDEDNPEDSEMTNWLTQNATLVGLDMPRLCLSFVRPDEGHWEQASVQYEGPQYFRVLAELSRRIPIAAAQAISV